MFRKFLRRLTILPFEVFIAQTVILLGFFGLIHFDGVGQDVLSLTIPHWLNMVTNGLYLLAGLATFVGVGLGRRDLEGFGIVGMTAGLLTRAIGLVSFSGPTAPVMLALFIDFLALICFVTRFYQLAQGKTLALADKNIVSLGDDDG